MEKPGKVLNSHSPKGGLLISPESKKTGAVSITFTEKGIKELWIPDRDKELMISDIFISGFCDQQNKTIKASIEIKKENKWVLFGPVYGYGSQSINFSHSFSNPISVDVGGGGCPKIRGKIDGNIKDKNFEITFTVLAYYKEEN